MKKTRRGLCFFLIFFISLIVCGCFPYYNYKKNLDEVKYPPLTFDVRKLNASTLILKLDNNGYNNDMYIADDFSNVKEYIEFLSPQEGFDYSDFILSIDDDFYGSLTYLVHFPIYWSIHSPYSYLSGDFGVSESLFLFFRSNDYTDLYYDINFSNLKMDVYNSAYGNKKHFSLNKEQLFDTYFVFGNYSEPCVKRYGNFYVTILFGGGFKWNDSICDIVYSIYEYYYKEFGKPIKLKYNYTIGFFPVARSYSSLASGFYSKNFNVPFLAHELFHLWQPGLYDCSHDLLYREGLATFMERYSLYETDIINKTLLENRFYSELNTLRNIPNLGSLYYLNQSRLIEIRKEDHFIYKSLIYSKGALVWKEIYDSGISINKVFRNFLKTGDCTEISDLISEYEKVLFEKLT